MPNPLQELIQTRLKDNDIRISHLASACGYRDLSRGVRKLQSQLSAGRLDTRWRALVVSVLEIPEDAITDAEMDITLDTLRRRPAFAPHIEVRHARRRPSPIFAAAASGGTDWLRISLPADFAAKAAHEQQAAVTAAVTGWLERYGKTYSPFGGLRAFILHYSARMQARLSMTGDIPSTATCLFTEMDVTRVLRQASLKFWRDPALEIAAKDLDDIATGVIRDIDCGLALPAALLGRIERIQPATKINPYAVSALIDALEQSFGVEWPLPEFRLRPPILLK